MSIAEINKIIAICYYYYYYYYAAFNAPCVGHKADESQAHIQSVAYTREMSHTYHKKSLSRCGIFTARTALIVRMSLGVENTAKKSNNNASVLKIMHKLLYTCILYFTGTSCGALEEHTIYRLLCKLCFACGYKGYGCVLYCG